MSTREIADVITGGDVLDTSIRVTIPEGFKIEAIENRLIAAGITIEN